MQYNNRYFSRVRSADIFTARDEMYLVFTEKKDFFFLSHAQRRTTESTT